MGVCPEQDAFYDRMTGHEWVTALLRLHGFGEREAADTAMAALEQVDLRTRPTNGSAPTARACASASSSRRRSRTSPSCWCSTSRCRAWTRSRGARRSGCCATGPPKGRNVIVSSHVLHEVEALTSDILLMHHGRVLAEGNVHQIRDLIDEHPHTVCMRSKQPRALATAARGERRCAERAVRGGCGVRADGEAGRVLCAHHRDGGERRRRATSTR